jgi:hypothetical protein
MTLPLKIALILILPIVIIAIVFSMLVTMPKAYVNNCLRESTKKISAEPTFKGIDDYIDNSLLRGMTQSNVLGILENVGSVTINKGHPNSPMNTFIDTAYVKICDYPFISLEYYIKYDKEGKLLDFAKVEEP